MSNRELLSAHVCAILVGLTAACSNDPGQTTGPQLPGAGAGAGVTAPVSGTTGAPAAAGTGTAIGSTAGTGTVKPTGGTGAISAGSGAAGVSSTTAGSSAVAGSPAGSGTGGSVAVAGTGGTGEAGEGGAAGTAAVSTFKSPCSTKPSQGIIMGDSYTDWGTHSFAQDLAKEAGERYRMYGVLGTSMGSGGVGLIPPQFDQAVRADPDIKFVVMTGGGNDVVVPDVSKWGLGIKEKCTAADGSGPMNMMCQAIVAFAQEAADKLFLKMSAAGVSDIVFFYYPEQPKNTGLGGADPNGMRLYARPGAKKQCDDLEIKTTGKTRCHWLDLEPVFAGHPEYFAANDVHETYAGSAAMAKAIVALMKERCVGQKAESGCCMP